MRTFISDLHTTIIISLKYIFPNIRPGVVLIRQWVDLTLATKNQEVIVQLEVNNVPIRYYSQNSMYNNIMEAYSQRCQHNGDKCL